MRDHTKLQAWRLADALVLSIYGATKPFPKEEQFGLTAQMRRGAVSIASNIVEGCGRRSSRDFIHFLDIAFASLRELQYQVSIAGRLGYFRQEAAAALDMQCTEVSKVLGALIRGTRAKEPGAQ